MESSLCCLNIGQKGTVVAVKTKGAMLRRFLDLGLVSGTRISCVLKSPSGDPAAYLIRGAVIALRKEDSEKIIIKKEPFLQGVVKSGIDSTIGRRES